eukprot:gene11670-24446_t
MYRNHALKQKRPTPYYHILIGIAVSLLLIFYLFRSPTPKSDVVKSHTDIHNKDILGTSLHSNVDEDRHSSGDSELKSNKVKSLRGKAKGHTHETNALVTNRVQPENIKISVKKKPILELVNELFDLGAKDPDALILRLNKDPFETAAGIETFECPSDHAQRITYPNQVDYTISDRFKNNEPGSWILFQHLRKAGGTSFCALAESNLGKHGVPPYFCMPDDRGSLAIPPWSDGKYISNHLQEHGYRLAENEWDALSTDMMSWPGAVLGTTFRHPIDRWYSQYRFEHLEHRDGSEEESKRMSFRKYYKSMRGWTITSNYYVKTFIGGANDPKGPPNMGDFYWTYRKYEKVPITKEMFLEALNNILHFHFILVLEYIDSSSIILSKVLNWQVPPKQVLPHESQAKRENKKSISAIEALSNEDYHYMQIDN